MKEKKKGNSGETVSFMTRKAAIKKLQITLAQFRKICIIKGIYPRDPKKKFKGHKTYYFTKDITFLSHDPLLAKFREEKVLRSKIKRAKGKHDFDTVKRLEESSTPYKMDHIIKERYPTFQDALHDLDDALSMIHLFSNIRRSWGISNKLSDNCARLSKEFQMYVVKSHSLRKTFVSIKGFYYQAEIMGETVTWLTPHNPIKKIPKGIDVRTMLAFLDFYQTLMGFILFKLYNSLGLRYPPILDEEKEDRIGGGLDSLLLQLNEQKAFPATLEQQQGASKDLLKKTEKRISSLDSKKLLTLEETNQKDSSATAATEVDSESPQEPEDAEFLREHQKLELESGGTLFKQCKVFLSREVPRGSLEFVIRSFGGQVSWEGAGAPFPETDSSITHQIIDRGSQRHQYLSRSYVQPQWVYDSVNEKVLLPTSEYGPSCTLPPHLSPFVDDHNEGYIPVRREKLDKLKEALSTGEDPYLVLADEDEQANDNKEEDGSENEEEDKEEEEDELEAKHASELKAELAGKGFVEKKSNKRKQSEKKEEIEPLEEIMMTRKNRKLYEGAQYRMRRKEKENQHLVEKRQRLEAEEKKKKQIKL